MNAYTGLFTAWRDNYGLTKLVCLLGATYHTYVHAYLPYITYGTDRI